MTDEVKRKFAKSMAVPYTFVKGKSYRELEQIHRRCKGNMLPLPPMRLYRFQDTIFLVPQTLLGKDTYAKIFLKTRPLKTDLIRAAKKLRIPTMGVTARVLFEKIKKLFKKLRYLEPIKLLKSHTKTKYRIVNYTPRKVKTVRPTPQINARELRAKNNLKQLLRMPNVNRRLNAPIKNVPRVNAPTKNVQRPVNNINAYRNRRDANVMAYKRRRNINRSSLVGGGRGVINHGLNKLIPTINMIVPNRKPSSFTIPPTNLVKKTRNNNNITKKTINGNNITKKTINNNNITKKIGNSNNNTAENTTKIGNSNNNITKKTINNNNITKKIGNSNNNTAENTTKIGNSNNNTTEKTTKVGNDNNTFGNSNNNIFGNSNNNTFGNSNSNTVENTKKVGNSNSNTTGDLPINLQERLRHLTTLRELPSVPSHSPIVNTNLTRINKVKNLQQKINAQKKRINFNKNI